MDENENNRRLQSSEVVLYYSLPVRKLASTVVSLPLTALVVCFVSAVIFQFDDVHETHCRVYNIIPSISAVTGISPQRYLWRIFIALHLAPRYLIAIVYKAQMSALLWNHKLLVSCCFWLSVAEITALAGTTYISNLDNFFLHENLFITFMLSSLLYMLVMLRIHSLAYPIYNVSGNHSFYIKLALFVASILATIGLVVFWFKHRLQCLDMAFSWFAFCEYVIALSNMAYHMTVALDFPSEHLLIGHENRIGPVLSYLLFLCELKTSLGQMPAGKCYLQFEKCMYFFKLHPLTVGPHFFIDSHPWEYKQHVRRHLIGQNSKF